MGSSQTVLDRKSLSVDGCVGGTPLPAADIIEGDVKLVLGLVWTIIQHYVFVSFGGRCDYFPDPTVSCAGGCPRLGAAERRVTRE